MVTEFSPAQLVEHSPIEGTSRYSLIFDDFGPCANAFEARGSEGGGYAWHGVVETLVRTHAPEVADRVKYDPESSMFAAYGEDRDALLRVAQLLREVHSNRALLERILDQVNLEDYD